MLWIILYSTILALFIASTLPWFCPQLYQQFFLGWSFFQWYCLLSAFVVVGIFLTLLKKHMSVILCFFVVFFSWGMTWFCWQDTRPHEYMSLVGNRSDYRIEKGDGFYSLCYSAPTTERLCMAIGSSVFPLELYVGKEIIFQAQLRSDWGKPMCYEESCPWRSKTAVLDMWDIELATPLPEEK